MDYSASISRGESLDILIPLGKGSKWQNNELRYCLRSIEKFATGYDRVFVIGEDPGFLRTNHELTRIDTNPELEEAEPSVSTTIRVHSRPLVVKFFPLKDITANKEARIAHKIFWAFKNTDIADAAVLFNDDYCLLLPTDLRKLPCYHRGDLLLAANRHRDEGYWNALKVTHEALSAAGKPTWHYDIHVPMILRRDKFLALDTWWQKSLRCQTGLVVKSTYANNTLDQPGPLGRDLKLRGPCKNIDAMLFCRWVFSYCDSGLTPQLKEWLVNRFPEKSRFET